MGQTSANVPRGGKPSRGLDGVQTRITASIRGRSSWRVVAAGPRWGSRGPEFESRRPDERPRSCGAFLSSGARSLTWRVSSRPKKLETAPGAASRCPRPVPDSYAAVAAAASGRRVASSRSSSTARARPPRRGQSGFTVTPLPAAIGEDERLTPRRSSPPARSSCPEPKCWEQTP